MKLEASAATDIGRVRKSNQDAVGCFPDLCLFMVADGMGGLRDGEVASRLAVEQIHGFFANPSTHEPPGDGTGTLSAAILAANERLLEEAERQGGGPSRPTLGATIVALHVSAERRTAIWGHVGDSRLYRARRGQLELLTADDTLPGAPYRGGAPVPLTLPHTNQLVQALGTSTEVEPTLGEAEIEVGDVYLLCSDGVSGLLPPEVIEQELMSESGVEEKAQNLIRLALEASGRDNASVVLVRAAP
jgi:PPM family protein phosphatase